MTPYNPYEAPQMNEPVFGAAPGVSDGAQMAILESMKKTRPWVLFLAILGFLGAGLSFLVGFVMMITGAAVAAAAKGPFGNFGPLLGIVYFVLGAFYVAPSVLLWRYGSAIGDYTRADGTPEGLATALQRQASFWRFIGISAAVMIGLYFVAIFIAVIAGVVAGVSRAY